MEQAEPAQKVVHNVPAVLGKHRLRVKLHAPVRQAIDLKRLDDAILAAGMHGNAGGLLYMQGVVAHHFKILRDSGEDAFARVTDGRDKTVARLRRARHLGTGQQT